MVYSLEQKFMSVRIWENRFIFNYSKTIGHVRGIFLGIDSFSSVSSDIDCNKLTAKQLNIAGRFAINQEYCDDFSTWIHLKHMYNLKKMGK